MLKVQITLEAIVLHDEVSVAVQAITSDGHQKFGKAVVSDVAASEVDTYVKEAKALAIGQAVTSLIMEGKL